MTVTSRDPSSAWPRSGFPTIRARGHLLRSRRTHIPLEILERVDADVGSDISEQVADVAYRSRVGKGMIFVTIGLPSHTRSGHNACTGRCECRGERKILAERNGLSSRWTMKASVRAGYAEANVARAKKLFS